MKHMTKVLTAFCWAGGPPRFLPLACCFKHSNTVRCSSSAFWHIGPTSCVTGFLPICSNGQRMKCGQQTTLPGPTRNCPLCLYFLAGALCSHLWNAFTCRM